MTRGGYDFQISTLSKIICEDADPIHVYLRFVRIELQLKNRLMLKTPTEFKKNIKRYHGHKLKEMFDDLSATPSDHMAILQNLLAKSQDLLKTLSYNASGQEKNPSYPYLRYLDCLSDDEPGLCRVVKGTLENLSECCREIEKWLRNNQ